MMLSIKKSRTLLPDVIAIWCLVVAAAEAKKKSAAVTPEWHGSSLSTEAYVESQAASAFKGEQVQVDFYSSFESDFDMEKMLSFKSTVVRLHDNINGYGAIQFNPRYEILDGRIAGTCRNSTDGSALVPLPDNCAENCINAGRYCDKGAFHVPKHHSKEYFKYLHIPGKTRVMEVARKVCVWREYGKEDPKTFFHYHEALKATGCDHQPSQECIEQSLEAAGMDTEKIQTCMEAETGLGESLDEKNSILEPELKNAAVMGIQEVGLPAIVINGTEVKEHNWDPTENLIHICERFPKDQEQPQICPFCLHFCRGDTNLCLWELTCADNSNFEDYVAYMNLTDGKIIEAQQQEPESVGWGILVMAAFITGGGLLFSVMGLRVWRTKMIIERYVREQKKEVDMSFTHQDPAYFPDDTEFDLDLEPALQYSDVLGVSRQKQRPPTGPPSTSRFLPHIN